ncbi:MAG: NAD-dependent epimerase/dehydratase family protein [Reichenbachiella sp.]
MNAILITGVAGLMGSRMAEWILQNRPEYHIVGIDNLSGGHKDFIPDGVEFIKADLIDCNLSELLKGKKIDYVYHFAAYAAEGLSPFIRRFNYQNNLVATANVINYSIKSEIKRLVFTSSMAVYGSGKPPFAESDLPAPVDPYGVAKYACEMDIKVANEQHGLEFCIIRPHNVYGINQNIWDKYRNVLGIWMYQKLINQPLTVFGEGNQKRAFSYIDDCLSPLWMAATSKMAKNEIINLGGIEETTILEAAHLLAQIVGGSKIECLSPRHEVNLAYSTHEKSVKLLGYQDNTDLSVGLKQMWAWAKTLPARERFEWDRFELDKGMYPFWKK